MDMRLVSYICFTIGLISVIAATTLCIQAIWTEVSEVFWRGIATCGVILLACIVILVLNSFMPSNKTDDNPNNKQ